MEPRSHQPTSTTTTTTSSSSSTTTAASTMKRSYDDANGSTTSSINGSPPACEIPPTFGRKRRSTSPPIPNSLPLAPVPSVFTDASGRIARIPTISRKVRACSACKKQKIRCDFEDGQSTCLRCKKMKLECVVNRSLQTILDEDVELVPSPATNVIFSKADADDGDCKGGSTRCGMTLSSCSAPSDMSLQY